jgi:hypothetical protein
MKDLIKKVLTDKKSRNAAILGMFLVTAITSNAVPWEQIA